MNRKQRRASMKASGASAAAQAGPLNLETYFRQARQCHLSGDLDSAAQLYQKILQVAPTHAAALHALGVIAHQVGRTDLAYDMLTAAIGYDKNAAEFHLSLGSVLETSGKLNEAIDSYNSALSINPQYSEAYYNIGNSLFKLGDADGAISSYKKALSINNRDADAHYNHGFALQSQERYSEAINSYRNALTFRRDYIKAASNIGFCLFSQGKLDEALSAYRQALEIKPDHAETIHCIGITLMEQGDLDGSIDVFNKALNVRSDWREALGNLGLAYRLKGQYEESLRAYQRVLTLESDDVETLNHIASLLALQGDADKAASYFIQSLTIKPDHIETCASICTTLQQIEREDENESRDIATYIASKFPQNHVLHRSIAGFLDTTSSSDVDMAYATELFDSSAARFDKTLARLGYDMPEKLSAEIGHLISGANQKYDILDAGCGTGLSGIQVRSIANKLVGVDLSEKMLSLAKARGIYDSLEKQDVISHLSSNEDRYDIIIASDVLIYVGDLSSFSTAAYAALRANGLCAVSAEAILDEGDKKRRYRISQGGRYQHAEAYLRSTFSEAGFSVLTLKPTAVRLEFSKPVPAWILVAQKQ